LIFLRRARHLASIVTLAALFLALVSLGHELRAQIQSPRQQQSEEASGQSNLANRSAATQIGAGAPTQADDADEKPREDNEWLHPTTLANIALVCVAIWAGLIAVRNLEAIERQVSASITAADAAKNSANAARDTFLSTHRPEVKIRAVVMSIPKFDTQVNEFIIATNIGATDATIVKLFTQWIVALRLPMENPMHSALDKTTKPMPLPAGGFIRLDLSQVGLSDDDVYNIANGFKNLFLFGYLKYTDGRGILRRTYFCRRYDRELRRFVQEENPDYNYTD
jgi:hypothetical protein